MGWNGSDRKGTAPAQPKVTAKKPSPVRGIVAGGLVCVLAVGAYFAFFSGENKPQKEKVASGGSGRIKAVAPAFTNKISKLAPPKVKVVTYQTNDEGLIMRYEDGKPRWLYWQHPPSRYGTVKISLDNPQDMQVEDIAMKGMPSTDLFLAYLYNARPGCEFGDAFDLKDFARHFLKSIQIPIIVSKDDPERVKEIKRGVIELRKELKLRHDAGEDIEAIVTETRKALQEDYRYRQQIEAEIEDRITSGTLTQEDAEDLYGAANKMLEAKGLQNVKLSDVVRRRIERMAKRRKAKLEKQEKQESK